MFSPFLDHFTDFYTFMSRFSPKQTGNSEYILIRFCKGASYCCTGGGGRGPVRRGDQRYQRQGEGRLREGVHRD